MAWFLVALARICGIFVHQHEATIPFIPTVLLNTHRVFDWVTAKLRDSGGTLEFSGPILSGKEYVITCDPRNMEYILKTNFDNFPRGQEFGEIFREVFGDGIFTSDGDSWRSQRRLANSHIHSKGFRNFIAKATQEMVENELLPLLTNAAREGSVIDLQDVLLRFTFDNTYIAIFGESLGCLTNGPSHAPFLLAIQDGGAALLYRHVLPSTWWKLLRFFGLGTQRKLTMLRKTLEHLVHLQISNPRVGTENLLNLYMSRLEDLNQFPSQNSLVDNIISFLLAGHDTSGAALTWFFWLVSQHPQAEAKILEELKNAVEKKNKKKKTDGVITVSTSSIIFTVQELQELNYLHAALCESLRLYPSIPIGHREVSKADVLPDGTQVRPGMKIFYSIYSMARMEWIWGMDCLDFKPERWINEDGKLKPDTTFNFLAFNGGPMTCLGKYMAFVQMKSVAAGILANFRLQVVQGHHVCYKVAMVLTMKNGLMVRLSERSMKV